VRTGYDPNYGARPLKRAIQREIETPLAKKIVAGEIREGQTIWIDADPNGDGLSFRAETPQASEAASAR
jgi:ATP-dependent Clp protease ATP-binding subunit ClpB